VSVKINASKAAASFIARSLTTLGHTPDDNAMGRVGSESIATRALLLVFALLCSLLAIITSWRHQLPTCINSEATSSRLAPFRSTPQTVATFSIVALDPQTGDLGVAVQSRFFGVGSVVPYARANVGAIATQAQANTSYGPDGLDLLASGHSAEEVVKRLTAADDNSERTQVGIVDANGRTGAHTGADCHGWAGHYQGADYSVQGNILVGPEVMEAMSSGYEKARNQGGDLADWLMRALEAGQEAGGDKRGKQSAAVLVVRENAGYGGANDRFIDLRVEDHKEPIEELACLMVIHRQIYAETHVNKPHRKPARIWR